MKHKSLFITVAIASLFLGVTVIMLEIIHYSDNKGAKIAEYRRAYLADGTIWIKDFSDSQGSDIAISETQKIPKANFWYVKVKHENAGGSGGYVTAITEIKDLVPGDRLILKEMKTRNANGFEFSILIAERAPTPRGH